MKIMFNRDAVAFDRKDCDDNQHFEYDLIGNFTTPYGVFIPMYTSGYLVIRALRGEFELSELKTTRVSTRFVHINHAGYIGIVNLNSSTNDISHTPITTQFWSLTGFRNNDNGNSIAYGHLLAGCKTIEKAVKRMDSIAYDGFFNPHAHTVKDIAKMLIDKDYTKLFIATNLDDIKTT